MVELKKHLDTAYSYWTEQYNRFDEDLKFYSGEQWDPSVLRKRVGKPCITHNFVKTTVNKIVNPVRKDPFGVRVKHSDPKVNTVFQGLIRDIEYKSSASEAYEVAFENAVVGGIGFIHVRTDYADDTSLNQQVIIDSVPISSNVWLDPSFTKADGSDAKYGFVVGYRSVEETDEDDETDGLNYDNLYSTWTIPEGSVPEMWYYRCERTSVKRYFLKDGSFIDEGEADIASVPEEFIAGSREVEKKSFRCTRYVGATEKETTTIPVDTIPIIAVIGDRIYEDTFRGYAGVVNLVRDQQKMVNQYTSMESELIQKTPVSPWVLAAGQVKGFEGIWASANTGLHDHLPYNPTAINGAVVPPPTRTQNGVDTSYLIASKNQAIADMQRSSGIFDNNIGMNEGAPDQSGRAILLKQNAGDVNSYHYIGNLIKSITQVGKVVLDLVLEVYDVERTIDVRGPDGSVVKITANLKELAQRGDFDTEVEAGPMLRNEKEMTTANLLEFGKLLPQKFDLVSDIFIENLDLKRGDEIAERFKASLPPELIKKEESLNGEPEMDPQAVAALEAAQQNINQLQSINSEYEEVIRQLQTVLLDNEKDRMSKKEIEEIKVRADLLKTKMNNDAKKEIELLKANVSSTNTDKKLAADYERDLNKTIEKAMDKENADIEVDINRSIEDANELIPKVGGPQPDIAGGEDLMGEADLTVESLDDLLE